MIVRSEICGLKPIFNLLTDVCKDFALPSFLIGYHVQPVNYGRIKSMAVTGCPIPLHKMIGPDSSNMQIS